jgi:ribose transport system substrate-binding protein
MKISQIPGIKTGWRACLGAGLSACVALAALAAPAGAQVPGARAKPFAAWPEPKIDPTLTVAQAKQIVAERTRPQTEWTGPSSGPKAIRKPLTIAWVSADQSYTAYIYWGKGITDAANAIGWKVVTFNGQGTVGGQLAAMNQALAINPVAIITPADANALQRPIQEAVKRGIPVIGIHATAFPGPSPELGLYMNIVSNPAQIGQTEAAYVIASSNGTGSDIHMVDTSYTIARFKAKATIDPIKNCSGCKFLEEVNVPIGDTGRISSVVSGLLARHGDSWWMTTCCDGYYPYVASALRSSGISPQKVKLVGADGPPATYQMIRKGNYEIASVPEPSTLFGYEAIDAAVRAMAGQPPVDFIQPTYLVTRENVDAEGGKENQFIPSNSFACHYANIWLGENKHC